MKILIISDLHMEQAHYSIETIVQSQCDLVCLIGDISFKFKAFKFIEELINNGLIVIYVLGNHEFYNINNQMKTVDEIKKGWKERSEKLNNFYFLDNDSIIINNIKFIGSIGWTFVDENKFTKNQIEDVLSHSADFQNIYTSKLMKGYRIIRGYNITLDEYKVLHQEALNYIKNELNKPFLGTKILLSHHPLCMENIELFNNMPIEKQFYYSNYNELIKNSDLDYYFHGHIHESYDYLLNNTRVICNPYGYIKYNELNKDFEIKLIEIN